MKPRNRKDSRFESKAVSIRRVAKVTAGGKKLRFSAMVVAGDKEGRVGVALGRGLDTRSAIGKAVKKAEKTSKKIQLVGDTIPHEIVVKRGAAKVMLRPAKPGTGVIAGSSVRTVLELCGIDNVYGKILGSPDLIQNAYCTFEALTQLRNKRVLAKMNNMKERIHLKETMEKQRKEREAKLREKEAKERKKNDKKGSRGRGRGRGRNNHAKRNSSAKPDAKVKAAKDKKAETKKEEK